MKPIYQYDKYRTGLVVVGIMAMMVALVVTASRLNLGARTYSAELEHTAALRVGEPVQVAGVGVGKVTKLELQGNKVRMEFTVDDDVTLGKDTTLEIKVSTLLGTHYLSVVPAGEGDVGDSTIPMARTKVPYNLQDVIEEGTPEVLAYDVEKIDAALGEMANLLDSAGPSIKPALTQVSKLSNLIAGRSDDIGKLLSAASTVTEQLTQSSDDIIALMKSSNLILSTLNTRREAIRDLLSDLKVLGVNLNAIVSDIKADAGPLLDDLNTVIDELQQHEKSLGLAVDNLAIASRYVMNAAGGGPYVNLYGTGLLPDAATSGASCGGGILC